MCNDTPFTRLRGFHSYMIRRERQYSPAAPVVRVPYAQAGFAAACEAQRASLAHMQKAA